MKIKLLLALCLTASLHATAIQYQVVISKSPYVELTGATVLSYYQPDSGYYFNTSFIFPVFGDHYANFNTQVANPVSAGGFMSNNGYLVTYDSIGKSDIVVFQCFENFKLRTEPGFTEASVKIEGSTGSRILKFQWKNLVYDYMNRQTANFQIWLHEADGSVSYHYGLNSVPPSTTISDGGNTGIIAVKGDGSMIFSEINLEGKPSAPVTYRDLTTGGLPTLDTIPPNGMVFTFKRSAAAVSNTSALMPDVQLYPNPSGKILHLLGDMPQDVRAAVYDISGRLIKDIGRLKGRSLDVGDLVPGAYSLHLYADNGALTRPFIRSSE